MEGNDYYSRKFMALNENVKEKRDIHLLDENDINAPESQLYDYLIFIFLNHFFLNHLNVFYSLTTIINCYIRIRVIKL